MDKNIVFLGVVAVAFGGTIWYQHRPKVVAAVATPAAVVAGKAAAGAPVLPGKPATASPEALKQQAAEKAARAEIEKALAPMKVTSILLGDPAIVIISKEEYSVGSPLKLPGGSKTLQVTAINEDGVTLVGDGQSFHLDAPGAPDLAASRKKL